MDFKNYQKMIETTIDLDQIKNHMFLINSEYKPELKNLKDQLDEVEHEIESLLDKVARDLDLGNKLIRLEQNDQHGYYFRVSRKV